MTQQEMNDDSPEIKASESLGIIISFPESST